MTSIKIKRKSSEENRIAKDFVDTIFSISNQKLHNNNLNEEVEEVKKSPNMMAGNFVNDIFSSVSQTNDESLNSPKSINVKKKSNASQGEVSSNNPKNNECVKQPKNDEQFYNKSSRTQKLKNVLSSDELLSNKNNKNNNHKIKAKSKRTFSDRRVTSNDDKNLNNNNNNMLHANSMFMAQRKELKEKKIIEEKIKLIRNHINALKNQEIYINKKAEKELEIQKKIKQKTEEKEVMKKTLVSLNIDKQLELEQKKKLVSIKKQKNETELKESIEKAKLTKINKYKEAYNERKKIKEKKQINNSLYRENNLVNIEKIRDQREKCKEKNIQRLNDLDIKVNKMYQVKYDKIVNETQKLRDEMAKLENIESEVIQNLKNTKKNAIMNNYLSNDNRNQNKKRGISSMGINSLKRNVDIEENRRKDFNKTKTNNKSITKYNFKENLRNYE